MSKYPEHDKLSAVKDQTQAIGEFLDWCGDEKGVWLYRYDERCDEAAPVGSFLNLLAEWAGIDQDKIETERRQMLDEITAANLRRQGQS